MYLKDRYSHQALSYPNVLVVNELVLQPGILWQAAQVFKNNP
jgi:hypothetical protein